MVCYRFATVSPGKSGQTVAVEAGTHARQVTVSGQVARNPRPQGLGSGSGNRATVGSVLVVVDPQGFKLRARVGE